MARTKLRACLRGRNRRLIVACAFGARAVSVVAQDARPTVVGADVAMNDVAQNARPTVVGCPMSGVAQDARRTVVGCWISRSLRLWRKVRWLMSRKMRDVRRGDV